MIALARCPARQGQPLLKKGTAVCIRQGVRQHPGQAFEGRFVKFPETVHTTFPYGHHQRRKLYALSYKVRIILELCDFISLIPTYGAYGLAV